MPINRRLMLLGSLAAIGMSATGCGSSTTVVVFNNHLPVPLSVNTTLKGLAFNKSNIQPGGSATQSYTTNYPKGAKANFGGTATVNGMTVDLATFHLSITAGRTNTFTVSLVGSKAVVKEVVT